MKYLKGLEVKNFKSYDDVHKITFMQFTSIIGPNGAGKSNLIDALNFVLGAGKIKATDYINQNQLKTREFRELYAKITFEDRNNENDKVEFTRVIKTKDCERFDVEYYIDDESVSANDYKTRIASDFNISPDFRNFLVLQNEISKITSKSARELTEEFERISGSIAFAKRYQTLEAEKSKYEEEVSYNEKKIKGIRTEKGQYQKQTEEAKKYEELLKAKKKSMVDHALWKLYHINQEIQKHKKTISQLNKTVSTDQNARKAKESDLQKLKSTQSKQRKAEYKLFSSLSTKKKTFDEHKAKIVGIKEEIKLLEKKIEKSSTDIDSDERELAEYLKNIQNLEDRLNDILKEEKDFKKKVETESAQQGVKLLGSQEREYTKRKEQVAKEVGKEQQELEKLTRENEVDQREVDRLTSQLNEFKERREGKEELRNQIETRKEKVTNLLSSSQTSLQRNAENYAELQQLKANLLKMQGKNKEELEKVENELARKKAEMKESNRDKRFREMLTNLKRIFPSVKDRLIDLCSVPRDRYKLAVTVTLGRNIDSIVVEDEKTAKECIKYIREQRLGTATFLPLDTLQVKPIDERLRENNGKLVIDAIKYDESIKKAVLYACGNTMICNSVADGIRMIFEEGKRAKVVTEDGVLIRKSGLMTGGISTSMESRAREWDQKEISKLKRSRETLLSDLSDIDHDLRLLKVDDRSEEDLENQRRGLENRIKYAQADLATSNQKLADLTEEINNLDHQIESLNESLGTVQAKIDKRNEEISDLKQVIKTAEDRIYAGLDVDIESIKHYEENRMRIERERMEKTLYYSDTQSQLKHQLEYERSRQLQTNFDKRKTQLKKDKSLLKQLESELKTLRSTADQMNNEINSLENEQNNYKKSMGNKEKDIKEARNEYEKLVEKINTTKKQISSTELLIDQLRVKRHSVYQNCKLEEIWDDLPLKNKEDDMDVEEEEEEEESSQSEYEKEDKIQISFQSLPAHLKNKDSLATIETKFQNELAELNSKIDKIDPNLKAKHKVQQVAKRLKTLKIESENTRQKLNETKLELEKVTKQRDDAFNQAFDVISSAVSVIYNQLTRGPNDQPGGSAYLTVDSKEKPYLAGVHFHAMPPEKRLRDMEQLSGGERALAGFALLYAIHCYKPAPFFLLDEIDANLDINNVLKIVRFVKDKKDDTQFIFVTHQEKFYSNSECLIGVVKDKQVAKVTSKSYSLNLTQYPD